MIQNSARPLRIGLTGGIGCGKTTVCNLFKELGINIIDTDIIARQIFEPGEAAYQDLVEQFSAAETLDKNKQVDRKKLRQIVFNDKKKLTQLEKITHPRIIERMREQITKCTSSYCILALPLLFEKNLQDEVDRVLVVDIDTELQKQRVASRDGSSISQVEAIMKHQISREKRLSLTDDIIINDGSIADLKPQVIALHNQYLSIET